MLVEVSAERPAEPLGPTLEPACLASPGAIEVLVLRPAAYPREVDKCVSERVVARELQVLLPALDRLGGSRRARIRLELAGRYHGCRSGLRCGGGLRVP